jgi:polysaccharide biosynthesis protein VpsM
VSDRGRLYSRKAITLAICRGAVLGSSLVAHLVSADSGDNAKNYRYLPWGPFDVIPTLSVRQAYDDNVIFSQSGKATGSAETFILPSIRVLLNQRSNKYELRYGLTSNNYWSVPRNNTLNHQFNGLADLVITKRNHLATTFGYVLGSNPLGTGFTQGDIALTTQQPDTYRQISTGATYTYGLPSARANLGLSVNYTNIAYDDNGARTALLDREDITLQPLLKYRIAPKTSLLFEFQNRLTRYATQRRIPLGDSNQVVSIDSDTRRYLVGAEWDASAQFKGQFRVGYLEQEFLDPEVKGFSGLSWFVSLNWAPLRYSTVTVNASRDVLPTLGFGSAQLSETYGAAWTHDWNHGIGTHMGVTISDFKYLDSNLATKLFDFRSGISYHFTRWYSVALDYTRQERSSSQQGFSFDRNLIMLSINLNQ